MFTFTLIYVLEIFHCVLLTLTMLHKHYSTVRGDGGGRVGEVRAGTTSPMPEHKGFNLQNYPYPHMITMIYTALIIHVELINIHYTLVNSPLREINGIARCYMSGLLVSLTLLQTIVQTFHFQLCVYL